MKRTSLTKKRSKKSGLPPGTLVHIGDTVSDDVEVYNVSRKARKNTKK